MFRSSLALAALVTLPLLAGCAAEIPNFDDDPRPEVCGGAICFSPQQVAVRRWGAGEVTMAAWRRELPGCEMPHGGEDPVGGSSIEVKLKSPKPGARLPIVPRDQAHAQNEGYALVRALRIEGAKGRALADEEAVAGEVTVLDIDPASGRLRLRIRARWSSGVSGEVLFDVEGPPKCE